MDLTASNLELPTVDLVVANLLIEYIGYECFGTIIKKLKPKYVSAIIQVDANSSFVSDSPYLHVFDDLSKIHQSIETDQLIQIMKKSEYHLINQDVQLLPNYKKLVQLDFKH